MEGHRQSPFRSRSLSDAQKPPAEPAPHPSSRVQQRGLQQSLTPPPYRHDSLALPLDGFTPRLFGDSPLGFAPEFFHLLPVTPTETATPLCSTTLDGILWASRPRAVRAGAGRGRETICHLYNSITLFMQNIWSIFQVYIMPFLY